MWGVFGLLWGLLGFSALLATAIFRLTPIALSAFDNQLIGYQWVALWVCLIFFAYFEGYKGFQKAFSPRMAARLNYLYHNPRPVHLIFAPLFGMGYFYAKRKRQIISISLTLTIIMFIILIRFLDQPWRGIIDAGVILGLAWGLISVWIFVVTSFTSKSFNHSPEIPD